MSGYLTGIQRSVKSHGLWITAVLTVVVFFGMFLFGKADSVVATLGLLEWWRIGTVFGLVTVSYGVRFLKWEYYLRVLDVDTPIRTSLLVFVSGLMMVVTPGKAGEVWKAWFFCDLQGVPVNRTASVVGAERVTDLLALVAFALLGLIMFDRSSTTLIGVSVLFLGGLVLLQWRGLCFRLLGAVEKLPLIGTYADELREFYKNTYTLFRPRPLGVAMAISVIAWGLEGIALWVVLNGFVPGSSLLMALFVFGLGSVVGVASLLPGGLGATEASMVGMLLVFEYSRTIAVSSTFVVRVGTLWYGAALGTAVFVVHQFVQETSNQPDS